MNLSRHYASRRANVMMVAIIIAILGALISVWTARTLFDHGKLDLRKRELRRAFYAAEAGVQQVVGWANDPSTYPGGSSFFTTDGNGNFANISAALASGSHQFPEAYLAVLEDENDQEIARVVELYLDPPDAADPVSSLFKIRAVGESIRGVQRTVVMFANFNPVKLGGAPAPLISHDTAGFGGNAVVHWGEVWSAGPVEVPNKSQTPTHSEDPWYKIKTEDMLVFPSNWQTSKWYGADDATAQQPLADEGGKLENDYGEVMYQHQDLDLPIYDYQTYKDYAIKRGRYYSTDASGDIYRYGIETDQYRIDSFNDEFSVGDLGDSAQPDFVFIDTIDGNPPADDGSNLATIQISGNSTQVKGLFYLAANLDMTGIGNPPALQNAEKPDLTVETLSKIFMNGIVYVSGVIDSAGNASGYGSLITEDGYTGTGTPDIYYNHQMANGIPFPIASTLQVSLWQSY